MATALTLVNAVLRRLRENQVTNFSAAYSALILDFVNETKMEVEEAWRWTARRTTLTVTTVPGQQLYVMTGSGQRFQFQDKQNRMFNSTAQDYLFPLSGDLIEEYKWVANATNGTPMYYRVVGSDGVDVKFELFPVPDKAYVLKIPAFVPNPELILPTDEVTIPTLPIILGTWARAISERGEDQGFKTTDQYTLYQNALSFEVAIDAARVSEELTWTVS